jgi:hypothetical protein
VKHNIDDHEEIEDKSNLEQLGEICEKECETCGCKPYKTSNKNMPFEPMPGTNGLAGLNKIKYENAHNVGMNKWKIAKRTFPLYTSALVTCSALMMDIAPDKHFLTHISGNEDSDIIRRIIWDIQGECKGMNPLECITNIQIWSGAGSSKDYGFYSNDPSQSSIPVILKILTALDLVEVRDGAGIFSKRDGSKIPIHTTCFSHYVGK